MSTTETPTERSHRGGVISLVVVGIVVVFLVLAVALAAVLGLFAVTTSDGQSPPWSSRRDPSRLPPLFPTGRCSGS